MQTMIGDPKHDTSELRQYTHLVWGYGTLIGRALTAREDPRALLDALMGVTVRTGASLSASGR